MKKLTIILITTVALITGCSKFDRVQALHDCDFEATKKSLYSSEYKGYVRSCMTAKGYKFDFQREFCITVGEFIPDCWVYSWRVFLY